ncbi:tetratricopeptide repeat protein [Leptospira venezuelensis]|uniref:tetratricopeptide repeat protein n=1 Tax=Leptospira venezuelensis TaxID=1958811 RepID=UPI000A388DDE|nr:tetratricopeptide repeat protein [Leptospira venezuelensis]
MFKAPNRLFKRILHTKDLEKRRSGLITLSKKYQHQCYGLLAEAILAEEVNDSIELADAAVLRAHSDSEILFSHFLLAEFIYTRLKTKPVDSRGIDYLIAESLLKKAIRIDPDYRYPKRQLALFYSDWGRYDSFSEDEKRSVIYARKVFFELYRKYKLPLYLDDYWICVQRNFSPSNALRALHWALKKSPSNYNILYALGESYEQIRNPELAALYYKKAEELGHPYLIKRPKLKSVK